MEQTVMPVITARQICSSKLKMKITLLFIVLLVSQNMYGQSARTNLFIDSYAKEHNFNGTILIQKNGRIAYTKSFGFANFQFRVPGTNQTKYKIASITKAFTSVLILQLHEQGRLDLQKTIGTYLPDYKGEAADKVTIHQLLNHTSGLENFDQVKSAEEAVKNGIPAYQTPYNSDDLLSKFCSGKLVNTPGKVFDYNNAEYIILGKILERIYGETFDQILAKQILQPLKMADTGMMLQSRILSGLADTYFFRDDTKVLTNDFPVYTENWYAAGSMYSTANDVLKFSNALFGSKLIKKETLGLMIKPGLDDYGYGVWSYETKINGKKSAVVKRPGRIMGAQSQLYQMLDYDVTVIILSNTGTTDLDEFVAEIGKKVVSKQSGPESSKK
jgi:D-alanyl-D-alanine carboxypeptidase